MHLLIQGCSFLPIFQNLLKSLCPSFDRYTGSIAVTQELTGFDFTRFVSIPCRSRLMTLNFSKNVSQVSKLVLILLSFPASGVSNTAKNSSSDENRENMG